MAKPVETPLPDTPAACHNCGQFRTCTLVKGEWYCLMNCAKKARRGTLSTKRNQDIPPRAGR